MGASIQTVLKSQVKRLSVYINYIEDDLFIWEILGNMKIKKPSNIQFIHDLDKAFHNHLFDFIGV